MEAQASPLQAPPPQTVPAAEAAEQPAARVAGVPAAAAIPLAPSNPDASVRVALIGKETVWVSARAAGKPLFSGILTANQTRTVEANNTLLLRVGNAGGINVTLNGKSLGALGARGQTQTVQFTPGGFQIVAASSPSLPL